MKKYLINGGNKLCGEIFIQGSKNAALALLAAAVLNPEESTIHNIPVVRDTLTFIKILEHFGCAISLSANNITVHSANINQIDIPEELARESRGSIILSMAMLGRFGKAMIAMPGGCELGPRPIDLHIKAIRQLGADIKEEHGFIFMESKCLRGANIQLEIPSVGVTETIMLAATRAYGVTTIANAAKDPEIIDLQNFLNSMGADITGAGTDNIIIKGVFTLYKTEYTVMSDHLVAGTYLVAAAMTEGKVTIQGTEFEYIKVLCEELKKCGCTIKAQKNIITLLGPKKLKADEIYISTMPYPGFPTDLQPIISSLLCITKGVHVIVENVFENRYKHINEFNKLGVNMIVDSRTAVIKGVEKLVGNYVTASDIRAGAALVLLGLVAKGTTTIAGIEHIERGYENIVGDLSALGADIKEVEAVD